MEPIVVCQMLLVEEVSNPIVASVTRCETAETRLGYPRRLVSFQVEHLERSWWC
jgi:hypothetical protein